MQGSTVCTYQEALGYLSAILLNLCFGILSQGDETQHFLPIYIVVSESVETVHACSIKPHYSDTQLDLNRDRIWMHVVGLQSDS